MTKPNAGDHRLRWSVLLAAIGVGVLAITMTLNGDSWKEALAVAGYSVGWMVLTFGVLYWLTGKYEDMRWNRPDHDLAAALERAKIGDDEDSSTNPPHTSP